MPPLTTSHHAALTHHATLATSHHSASAHGRQPPERPGEEGYGFGAREEVMTDNGKEAVSTRRQPSNLMRLKPNKGMQ
jgi:hypothetical protein